MAFSPVPFVVQTSGDAADAPAGAIPANLYGATDSSAVVEALVAAGFGTAGQVLAMNPTGNGFVWTTPASP